MSPPLFLLDDLPDGSAVRLVGDEGRHAARVQRLQRGEIVLVGDGRGAVARCVVAGVLPDGLDLEVTDRRFEPPPSPRLVVVQALPKGERADLAVELLTELGVDEIVPWSAARSIVQWQGPRGDRALEKWRRTAREAAKQSRRAWLPVVVPLHSTPGVVERAGSSLTLVLHEEADVPLAAVALGSPSAITIVVGPEGGIAPDELAALTAAGATRVRLGAEVLRTSTAGGAALAVVSTRLGRWGGGS